MSADYDRWKTSVPDPAIFYCEVCEEREATTNHEGQDVCYPCRAELLTAGGEEQSTPAAAFKKAS